MGPKPAGPHWLWQAGGRQEIRRLEHPAVRRMSSSVDEPQAAVALRTPAEAADDSTASLADQTLRSLRTMHSLALSVQPQRLINMVPGQWWFTFHGYSPACDISSQGLKSMSCCSMCFRFQRHPNHVAVSVHRRAGFCDYRFSLSATKCLPWVILRLPLPIFLLPMACTSFWAGVQVHSPAKTLQSVCGTLGRT